MEATVGIEPTNKGFADPRLTTWPRRHRRPGDPHQLPDTPPRAINVSGFGRAFKIGQANEVWNGAGNEIRTRDPNLGKVVLYH